jgi:hypothetical protein
MMIIPIICEGRGYKDVYWKLLKKVGVGKGVRQSNGRGQMNQNKVYFQQDT